MPLKGSSKPLNGRDGELPVRSFLSARFWRMSLATSPACGYFLDRNSASPSHLLVLTLSDAPQSTTGTEGRGDVTLRQTKSGADWTRPSPVFFGSSTFN